jgi:transposase
VTIPEGERPRLEEVAAAHSAPSAYRLRAKMILLLAEGEGPTAVARRLGTSDRNVRKWRARWDAAPSLDSIRDRDRGGAPPKFSLPERCELVKLACDRPDGIVAPFREEWSQGTLAEVLRLSRGIEMSRSTVQRILASNGLRPHRVRQWLHSPDPEFREKVERVCALYAAPPEGAIVLCVDEKPLQALERVHPTGRAADASVRHEFEYVRHGVGALLAAFDIRTGKVIGRVVDHRDSEALVSFLEEIAAVHPEREVYIVWDNLNIHHDGPEARWTRFNERHGGRFHFVHTPLHASWVNQVEIWFSILHRRVIRYGSFDSRDRLAREVIAFVRFWNQNEAHPFRWKFSGDFDHARTARAA